MFLCGSGYVLVGYGLEGLDQIEKNSGVCLSPALAYLSLGGM